MATIGKIRKRSGLIIAIIGIALAAFVLGDLFKGGGSRGIPDFGAVNGEKITYAEFNIEVDKQIELFKQQQQLENLDARQTFQIRQSVWEQMTSELILNEMMEELGLALSHKGQPTPSISPEELYDLVLGNNPHSYILQSFTDPQTGQFMSEQVRNIMTNFSEMDPEMQMEWVNLEAAIKKDRLRTKFFNLISKGYYVPKALAEVDYKEKSTVYSVEVVGVRYNYISDSAVSITEEDYQNYYEEHKHEYEQEKSRDIHYVIYEVLPSEADHLAVKESVDQVYTEFTAIEGDEKDYVNYVNSRSDKLYDSAFFKKGELPVEVDSLLFASEAGSITPPYFKDQAWHIYRLMDKQMRPDSMKASHILIAFQGAYNAPEGITLTREEAEKKADSLLLVAQSNPGAFGALALQNSMDPSAQTNQGDLDWFADGAMVYPFNQACFETAVGQFKLVESVFGFHVVYVTGKKDAVEKARVAEILIKLEPSEQTYDDKYAEAVAFVSSVKNSEEFFNTVKEQGLNTRQATYVRPMDYSIPGLENPRGLIRWAFDEKTEKGNVAPEVFDVDGKYVVATVTELREKGIATLEQVKSNIEPLVRREKKAETIMAEMSGATSDLTQLAAAFNAKVDTIDYLTFSSFNFPKFGPEPALIGKIFAMDAGQVSAPIKGGQAVFVVKVVEVKPAAQLENFSSNAMQMIGYFQSRLANPQNNLLYKAIEKQADIYDNRVNYY